MTQTVSEVDRQREAAKRLHRDGLTIREIAAKLGITVSAVSNRLYYKPAAQQKAKEQAKANGNGNGDYSKELVIGICYAETERFLGVLGERFGVSAKVLRSRLSELLGHPPLR